MAPDRPDSSNMETAVGLTVSHVLDCGEAVYSVKEEDIVTEGSSIDELNEGSPRSDKFMKSNQSDDDLTSLTWLHQQNLLKSLEISNPSKNAKEENVLNNNICDDSVDLSENTNSISSIDESYSPESNGKSPNSIQSQGYQSSGRNHKVSQIFQEKILFDGIQSNHSKISLSNNNLPVSNRMKHPTHIPYDPQLHKNSKPPYSFSCLIFMAIEDSPVKALPVKEVYAWILDHFPYFRNAPTGWKNSVRHNLSLNKCFRKVEKAPNLGKGSLWMVDAQYRPNLIQALSRAPFPPPTAQHISSPEKVPRKSVSTRLPDPVLFPYLSKRLASSSICDTHENEIDSDVDAAATTMLSFKHGPIILNHNKDRKRKYPDPEKLVPVITRSSSEDHTYSCITSIKLESKRCSNTESSGADFDEQRKIAEGADALLNLAGVSTVLNQNRGAHNSQGFSGGSKIDGPPKAKRRSTSNDYSNSDKRRRRWREWGEGNRYLKQVKG